MLTSLIRPLSLRVARLPLNSIQCRTLVSLKDHKYTAHAIASGQGRNGEVVSNGTDAAPLELKLTSPKSLGGPGTGQNPEQLFAMGYASCFLGALQYLASNSGKKDAVSAAKVHTFVHFGESKDTPGFGIAVDIEVEGVAEAGLIQEAHAFCPYSRAMSQGVEVTVKQKV